MWKRNSKIFLIPTAAIIGVSLGSLAGAMAFDHLAARYLWPEPEDVVVRQAASPLYPPSPPGVAERAEWLEAS